MEENNNWDTPQEREVVLTYSHGGTESTMPEKNIWHEAARQEKKRRRRITWICVGCTVLLAILVVLVLKVAGTMRQNDKPSDDGGASSIVDIFGEKKTSIERYKGKRDTRMSIVDAQSEILNAQQVFAKVCPATVTVMAELEEGASVGTGIIMTEDGYILTNAHVVSGGKHCWVALSDGRSYDVELVGMDTNEDVAVLKAVDAKDLPVAEFGNSDRAQVGEAVYAIGNPLGLELRGTLTDGIISAVSRQLTVDGKTMCVIQTNAALNNGNSGGPLINQYGQVIGMNTLKMGNKGLSKEMTKEATVEGLGFALPISDVFYVVNDLIAYGEYRGAPAIGITVVTEQGDGMTAVTVYEVANDSGAKKAGIQPGDVVLKADGVELHDTGDLLVVRRSHVVGDTVKLTIQRDGKIMDVDVVLQASKN